MSDLQVKTRGDSSPQGKPRLYFSCHPEDFDVYFEVLADEILQTQNCGIWYETDWNSAMDETQLSQMQLFIVPITTKYLTRPSRSRSEEYRFAIEQHIPVLPIMMESDLEYTFSQIMNREGEGFGDLQFLDRASEDKTAIAYAEKLEKRLSTILTDDETAARVRAAFDAYIFLSYRKKDRAAAQSLMRLIHQISYCQDIAIWYDEFLVPGEQWAKTIADAMERSQLVTFAITPHMTERGNYVMEHEFPEAMRSGKPMVSAEVEATDRAVLAELFPGLPELVDGKSKEELELALQQIALKENDHDPAHNYLIGLAYLGAIDVERDAERAVRLIRGAAEAELPEAMNKLVDMYFVGEGVNRDYSAAVDWQNRLVAVHRRRFQQTQSEAEADKLFSELWYLFNCQGELLREEEQWETAQEMLQIAAYTEQNERRRNLLVSYNNLGNIAKLQERLEEAKTFYEKMLSLGKSLVEETGTVEARRDLSVSYEKLGNIAKAQGRLEEAKTYHEQSLSIDKELFEEMGTMEARRDLSVTYNRLGAVAEAQGRLEEAKNFYEQGLALRKELVEETGTVRARRDLSGNYNRLGDIAEAQGRLEEAKNFYEQGLTLRKELVEETGTEKTRRELSISYNNLGGIAEAQGRLEEAKTYYEKSLTIRKKLAEETGTVRARRDLSVSYINLGDIARVQGWLEEAKTYYEKSLTITKELFEETGTVKARCDLSVSYNRLGFIAEAQGRLEEAKTLYEKMLSLAKSLFEETGTVKARRDLSFSYEKLGDIVQAQEQLEEAKTYFEKSLTIRKKLAEETGTVEARRDLLVICIKLGDIVQAQGQLEEARTYCKKSLTITKELFEETGTVEARRDLSVSYERMGGIAREQGRRVEARVYYEQVLAIREALAEEMVSPIFFDDLGIVYVSLWQVANLETERREYLSKAVNIYRRLVREWPKVSRYQRVLELLEKHL